MKSVHPDIILDFGDSMGDILERLTKLEADVAPIKAENKELRRRNEYLEVQHRQDVAIIRKQEAEISTLQSRLDKLEKPKKDSHNSSVPPSKEDIASSEKRKRTQSLCEPSGRKPGGQPGHGGSTLHREESVDSFVDIPFNKCSDCGEDLSGIPGSDKATRQMIDICFPAPVVTQHSIIEKVCPSCGHTVSSKFPEGVILSQRAALVVYLSEEHAVSYQRIKRLLNDMLLIYISEGEINIIVQRMIKRARSLYERVKAKIEKSHVAGADETGIDIAGILYWLWVWQAETASYFKPQAKRGYKATEETFDEGLPDTVLVTDRYGSISA